MNFVITTQVGTCCHCPLGYDAVYLVDRYYRRFDVNISTYKTEAGLCSYQSTKIHVYIACIVVSMLANFGLIIPSNTFAS
jgi:hypothetical protein